MEHVADLAAPPPAETVETGPPSPGWWHGRFFPNDCTARRGEFERVRATLVQPVDYLPTEHAIGMASGLFGARAGALVEAWRDLWRNALGEDVDGFVAREAPLFREPADRLASRLAAKARDLIGRDMSEEAAQSLYDASEAVIHLPPPLRDPAFHVLQDASRHLTLARSGAPFSLVLRQRYEAGRCWPHVFCPDGRGGMRMVETGSPAWEEARRHSFGGIRPEDPYWRIQGFRSRAGRPMAVAKGLRHLCVILADMAAQGHGKAFLKSCMSKAGTWVVDLDGVGSPPAARDRVAAAAGLGSSISDDGHSHPICRGILVQGFVPFVREHRFLVVGHRVVASTASDRLLSVLDADPSRVLGTGVARLRVPAAEAGPYDRGAADVEIDRDLLARMAWGARDLARVVREHVAPPSPNKGTFDCYCIDMGQADDGRVLPIEVNGFDCGLYAADHGRVAAALARRAPRIEGAMADPPAADPSGTDPLVDFLAAGYPVPPDDMFEPDERPRAGDVPARLPPATCPYPPAFTDLTLALNGRTGWPPVGITRVGNAVDGRMGEGEAFAWGLSTPDGKVALGPSVGAPTPEGLAGVLDARGIRPNGKPVLAAYPIDRETLLRRLERDHVLWEGEVPEEHDVEHALARLGHVERAVVTPESLESEGVVAFPPALREDCVDATAAKMFVVTWRPLMPRIPWSRELERLAAGGHALAPAVTAHLVEADATVEDREAPIRIPPDATWKALPREGEDADHWPLPGQGRSIAGREVRATELHAPGELARIVMSLHAHTRRVRLLMSPHHPFDVGLAAVFRRDELAVPDAADLWDLCKGFVICGQEPPRRLVAEALAAGDPPALPPEVARAVGRAFGREREIFDAMSRRAGAIRTSVVGHANG